MAFSAAIVQQAANTSTGNQDFTKSGFGTPDYAFVIVNRATTNASAATHASLSFGATDGTRERVSSVVCEDGSTDNQMVCKDDKVIAMIDPTAASIEAEAEFVEWVTDGIRVNWTTAPGSAVLVTVVLCKGVANVYCGDYSTGGVDVTDPGFTPSFVHFGGCHATQFGAGITTPAALTCGFAVNDGSDTQGSWTWGRYESFGSVTFSLASDSYVQVDHDGSTVTDNIDVSDFDGNGFTMGGVSGVYYGWYLAVELEAGDAAEIAFFDTPTSGGSDSVSGLNLTPVLVMLAMSRLTAFDTPSDGVAADSIGFSAFTADDEVSVSAQANSTNSDTQSYQDDKAVRLPNAGIGAGLIAVWTSMDAGGWTLDWGTVSSARKFTALAIGPSLASAPKADVVDRHVLRGVNRGILRGVA